MQGSDARVVSLPALREGGGGFRERGGGGELFARPHIRVELIVHPHTSHIRFHIEPRSIRLKPGSRSHYYFSSSSPFVELTMRPHTTHNQL
jgi:hypothetical protein